MFKTLSRDTFSELIRQNKSVLIYKQFPADVISPVAIYNLFKDQSPSALIEINYPQESYHYTFIGIDPYLSFHVKNGLITIQKDDSVQTLEQDPIQTLWTLSQSDLCIGTEIFPHFFGGLIGFMAYDAVRLFQQLPSQHPDLNQYPDLLFHAYRRMFCYNHKNHILTIGVVASPKEEYYDQAIQKMDSDYTKMLSQTLPPLNLKLFPGHDVSVEVEIEDAAFCAQVKQVQEKIKRGELHKTIITRTFKLPYRGTSLTLFRASRMVNPSPCHFLLQYPDFAVVGASPGKLISVKNRELEITPLAGTYPRKSEADDAALDKRLLNDPKENTEHMMLVEAVKEDLAKISIPSTIHISKLKVLEHFSHVTHIVSYVNGTLAPKFHALDALKAAFPAGTLSGIPKIKAMTLIDQLEKSRRGIYSGAVCALDPRGNLDSVLINRTAIIKDGVAYVRAGAGVVVDSDPQKEADESRHKAKAMLESLKIAESWDAS